MKRDRSFDYQADAASILAADPTNRPALMRVETAAIIADRTSKHIREQLAQGNIKGNRLGRSWRVHTAAFLSQLGID